MYNLRSKSRERLVLSIINDFTVLEGWIQHRGTPRFWEMDMDNAMRMS